MILPIHGLMAEWLIWKLNLECSLFSLPHWALIGLNNSEPIMSENQVKELEDMYIRERFGIMQ